MFWLHGFFGKNIEERQAGRTLTNLSAELQLIEETFGLISDEVLLAPPGQILSDNEGVIGQAHVMVKTLEEIGAIE